MNEVGNDNNKVLELTSTGGGIAYFQVFTPTYEVDKTYTVSYRMRTTGGNIGFTNYSELIVSGWNSHGWKQAKTTWQTVSYEITATQSKSWANIGIQFDGATGENKLYIDDFSVTTSETKTNYEYKDGLVLEDGDYALLMSEMTSAMNTATGGKLTVGTTYEYSFYVKTKDTGSDFALDFCAGSIKKSVLSGAQGTSDTWTLVTGSFKVPEGGTDKIGFERSGTGEVYVDDIALCSSNFMANGSFDKDGTYDATGWENIGVSEEVAVIKTHELVENGDFEAGNSSSGNNGWETQTGNRATLSVVDDSGNKALQVVASASNAQADFYVGKAGFLEIGRTYTVSFDIKRTSGTDGLTLYTVNVIDSWETHGWKALSNNWTTITMQITPQMDQAWAQIGFQLESACTVLVDNFSISYTDVDTTTTVTNVVQNGDFETGSTSFANGGWYTNSPVSLQVADEVGNENNKVLELTSTGGGIAYFQVFTPTYEVDKTYTVSYRMRTTGGNIGFTNYSELIVSGWNSHGWKQAKTTWQTVSYEITATQSKSWANIGIQFDGATGENKLYIDDFSVTTSETKTNFKNTDGLLLEDGDYALFMSEKESAMNTVTGAKLTVGTTYDYSFYVKTKETSSDFALNFCADSMEKTVLSGACEDSDTWRLVTGKFTVSEGGVEKIGFKRSGTGDVFIDDIVISVSKEVVSETEDITLTYGEGSNFHYEQEYRLYIQSTGTEREDLTGTLQINGREVSMKYEHHNGSVVLLFNGKLSETDVNTVVIPAGTTLYKENVAVYNVANTFTIYTQKVADKQWMTWLSEYDYQGGNVLYYDMGTAGTKYVFNNEANITYQGVMIVTGKANFMLGGTVDSESKVTSREVTDLGDYNVSRTIKGEKYDYTVALYKRGDADKTQDGVLTAKDLIASKLAAQAEADSFGYARYKAADSNTDGVVNEEDAEFLRYILANDYDIMTTTSKGYSTLGQGVMPIVGYGGPDDHATSTNPDLTKRSTLGYQDDFLTDSIFSLVEDMGFNVFANQVNEVGNDYETSTKMLKLAEKHNLGVYVYNAYISNQSYVEEQLPIQTAKYDSFSSFHGYYVADEPTTNDINKYTTSLTKMKDYVHLASYFNLLPISDSDFLLGGYESYMNKAAATDAEALVYDLYLRGQNKTLLGQTIRTSDFYKNLDVARTASSNNNKPFYAFVQTGTQFESTDSNSVVAQDKMVTVQEMYLEANAALAMGAKGINYYTLIQGTEDVSHNAGDLYSSGLITLEGKANHGNGGSAGDGNDYNYYDAAKKINKFIASVDEVLMNATSTGVISDSSTVKSNVSCELSGYGAVQSITGSNYMVGCFDYYGKDAYLIVNITPDEGSRGTSRNITLNFDGTYSYTATDMTTTKKTISGNSASFSVGAGEAVLVVVE